MRMHAGCQTQARQRTRRRILGQCEARRIGTVGQIRQLVAASSQHLARTLHRFRQARLRLGIPFVDALEHVRGVLLHIDDVADKLHAHAAQRANSSAGSASRCTCACVSTTGPVSRGGSTRRNFPCLRFCQNSPSAKTGCCSSSAMHPFPIHIYAAGRRVSPSP